MTKKLTNFNFRLPAEWETQDSIWITWPYNENDWPDLFIYIPTTVGKIVAAISKNQKVNLILKINEKIGGIKKILINFKAKLKNIKFFKISTNRIWIRDFGPIYLTNKKNKVFINFKFNGWAKYNDYKKDDKINSVISKLTKIRQIEPMIKIGKKIQKMVLEGGAIDVNGNGSILLTKECLLSKTQERNPGINKLMYEKILSNLFNVKNFIWLNKGIKGDDTHGHIDDVSRFVSKDTIMTAVEKDKNDKNYNILKENLNILNKTKDINGKNFKIIKIPMPKPIYIKKIRVPASYMNFLICNKIILLPLFNDPNDKIVINIFKKYFNRRKIVGIDCTKLIWGFGAIHCMTQHEPRI